MKAMIVCKEADMFQTEKQWNVFRVISGGVQSYFYANLF